MPGRNEGLFALFIDTEDCEAVSKSYLAKELKLITCHINEMVTKIRRALQLKCDFHNIPQDETKWNSISYNRSRR